MFDYIKGCITDVRPECIVVENGRLGYQLIVPNPFQFQLSTEVTIYTYMYVREDLLSLYGFASKDERTLFIRLLSVSGIGPKGALAIVASTTPSFLVQAIEEENEPLLVKFPGIGKKTARQIILDLKGKLGDFEIQVKPNLFELDTEPKNGHFQALSDAIEALRSLGYGEKEIKKVEKQLRMEQLSTEEYIRKALRLFIQG